MKRSAMAIVLLMSSLVLAACETKRTAVALRPDHTNPERFQCAAAGARPAIPPEYVIDWSRVTTVEQAKAEHMAFVRSIRTREGVVAGYVVEIEGRLFICSNNAAWLRDYYSHIPE